MGLAYFVPMFAAVGVAVLLFVTGIDEIGVPQKYLDQYGSSERVLAVMLLAAPTIGVLTAAGRALGEEIGWRGFIFSFRAMHHPSFRF